MTQSWTEKRRTHTHTHIEKTRVKRTDRETEGKTGTERETNLE